jgi:serine/threonine-protein kinase
MNPRIGRYEIQEELGRGAFGRVYRAYDPSVKRAIAIKVLTAGNDPDIMDRFRSEAGTTGNLTHNNIVTVYEYGEHEGQPYIAMELLEGQTLQKVIQSKRPLSLLEKVRIMHQVADGLAAARAKGVIHRDIKPANIMLLPNGDAKIMDFGIARMLDKDGARRTRKGDMVGTLLYMSPEQFQGFDADEITDIFAYGIVYYELLAGVHPFTARDAGIVMFRITTVDPPPLRDAVPDCPDSLDQAVRRTLAKHRDMRTRSFEEVVLDFTPILHELKCQRAAELMGGVQELVDGGQLDVAQSRIRQVLELDAFNQEARRWRRTLQERQDRNQPENKSQQLLQAAAPLIEAKRFDEAARILAPGLRDYPNDEALRRMYGEAARQAVLQRIGTLRTAGQLDKALQLAARSQSEFGADPRIEAVQREMETVQRVESTERTGQFEQALRDAQTALARYPDAADLTAVTQRLETRIAETAARRRQAHLEAITAAADAQDWTTASTRLQQAQQEFPNHPDWQAPAERIRAARQKQELEQKEKQSAYEAAARRQALAQAMTAAADAQDWNTASTRLQQAQQEFPNHPDWQPLTQRIYAARQQQEQKEKEKEKQSAYEADVRRRQSHLEAITASADAQDWTTASTRLQQAQQEFPNHPDWQPLAERIRAAREQEQREAARRQAHLQAIAAAADAQDWTTASTRLQQAQQEFPNHPDWQAPAERIRTARRLAIAAAADAQDWTTASTRLQQAQQEFPNHPDWQPLAARLRTAQEKPPAAPASGRNEAQRLAASGDLDGAIALLERLIRQDPANPDLQTDLSLAKNRQDAARLRTRGNLESALIILDNLLQRNPARDEIRKDRDAVYEQILRQADPTLLQKLVARGAPDNRAHELLTRTRQAPPIPPPPPWPTAQAPPPAPPPLADQLLRIWPILAAAAGFVLIVLWALLH